MWYAAIDGQMGQVLMKFRIIVYVLALLIVHSYSGAFDKSRKGFCLGAGIGVAPLANYSTDYYCYYNDRRGTLSVNQPSFASNFFIGYGWDQRNILVLEFQMTTTEEKEPPCPRPPWSWSIYIGPEPTIYQIYIGPLWYHYFSDAENAYFSMVGLGLAYHDEFGNTDPGLGIMLGGGYGIGRRLLISSRFFHGTSHPEYIGQQHNLNSWSILLTKFWYWIIVEEFPATATISAVWSAKIREKGRFLLDRKPIFQYY